jgi:hypothetical protein
MSREENRTVLPYCFLHNPGRTAIVSCDKKRATSTTAHLGELTRVLRACHGAGSTDLALSRTSGYFFLTLPAGAFLSRDTLETPSQVVMIFSA